MPDLVGELEDWEDALFRFLWKVSSETELGSESQGRLAQENDGNSRKVWYGCKLEALRSIMYHGKLWASSDAEGVDRFFVNTPGVYVFAGDRKEKGVGLRAQRSLRRRGELWSTCWEAHIGRTMRIVKKGADQWSQPEGSLRLAALWVGGGTHENMANRSEIQER